MTDETTATIEQTATEAVETTAPAPAPEPIDTATAPTAGEDLQRDIDALLRPTPTVEHDPGDEHPEDPAPVKPAAPVIDDTLRETARKLGVSADELDSVAALGEAGKKALTVLQRAQRNIDQQASQIGQEKARLAQQPQQPKPADPAATFKTLEQYTNDLSEALGGDTEQAKRLAAVQYPIAKSQHDELNRLKSERSAETMAQRNNQLIQAAEQAFPAVKHGKSFYGDGPTNIVTPEQFERRDAAFSLAKAIQRGIKEEYGHDLPFDRAVTLAHAGVAGDHIESLAREAHSAEIKARQGQRVTPPAAPRNAQSKPLSHDQTMDALQADIDRELANARA